MKKLDVFDPPMCCSSGGCGPNVDPVLPRFAGDLEWLKGLESAVRGVAGVLLVAAGFYFLWSF